MGFFTWGGGVGGLEAGGGWGWGWGCSNPFKAPSVPCFVQRQKTRNEEAGGAGRKWGGGWEELLQLFCLRNTAAPHVLGQCQGWTPRLPQGGERCVCVCVSVYVCVCVCGCLCVCAGVSCEPVETGGLLFYPAPCPTNTHLDPEKQALCDKAPPALPPPSQNAFILGFCISSSHSLQVHGNTF